MAVIYVRRKSTPCIRRGMGDVKACHVYTRHSIRILMPCITRGIYCEFTSSSKRRFPSLESEAGIYAGTLRWGDILSWQGTFGPRTTRPGGQLVLGPDVRGDIWSGGTRGPPTT